VPFVRGVLAPADLTCALEAASIAYLLRTDRPAALARLRPDADRTRGCVAPPWDPIAAHRRRVPND